MSLMTLLAFHQEGEVTEIERLRKRIRQLEAENAMLRCKKEPICIDLTSSDTDDSTANEPAMPPLSAYANARAEFAECMWERDDNEVFSQLEGQRADAAYIEEDSLLPEHNVESGDFSEHTELFLRIYTELEKKNNDGPFTSLLSWLGPDRENRIATLSKIFGVLHTAVRHRTITDPPAPSSAQWHFLDGRERVGKSNPFLCCALMALELPVDERPVTIILTGPNVTAPLADFANKCLVGKGCFVQVADLRKNEKKPSAVCSILSTHLLILGASISQVTWIEKLLDMLPEKKFYLIVDESDSFIKGAKKPAQIEDKLFSLLPRMHMVTFVSPTNAAFAAYLTRRKILPEDQKLCITRIRPPPEHVYIGIDRFVAAWPLNTKGLQSKLVSIAKDPSGLTYQCARDFMTMDPQSVLIHDLNEPIKVVPILIDMSTPSVNVADGMMDRARMLSKGMCPCIEPGDTAPVVIVVAQKFVVYHQGKPIYTQMLVDDYDEALYGHLSEREYMAIASRTLPVVIKKAYKEYRPERVVVMGYGCMQRLVTVCSLFEYDGQKVLCLQTHEMVMHTLRKKGDNPLYSRPIEAIQQAVLRAGGLHASVIHPEFKVKMAIDPMLLKEVRKHTQWTKAFMCALSYGHTIQQIKQGQVVTFQPRLRLLRSSLTIRMLSQPGKYSGRGERVYAGDSDDEEFDENEEEDIEAIHKMRVLDSWIEQNAEKLNKEESSSLVKFLTSLRSSYSEMVIKKRPNVDCREAVENVELWYLLADIWLNSLDPDHVAGRSIYSHNNTRSSIVNLLLIGMATRCVPQTITYEMLRKLTERAGYKDCSDQKFLNAHKYNRTNRLTKALMDLHPLLIKKQGVGFQVNPKWIEVFDRKKHPEASHEALSKIVSYATKYIALYFEEHPLTLNE